FKSSPMRYKYSPSPSPAEPSTRFDEPFIERCSIALLLLRLARRMPLLMESPSHFTAAFDGDAPGQIMNLRLEIGGMSFTRIAIPPDFSRCDGTMFPRSSVT